ncbi:LysM peptidoglycan-binding domain-containing protein [Thermomonas brevis]
MSNDKKPDFSDVQGGVRSTEQIKPDFSDVQSKVTSTEAIAGNDDGAQTYTVAKGDNLSRIAQQFYGRQDWKRIFDANRDQLSDPDRIQPGQVLKIPAPEGDA